jgi:DMSO/TMAO reductase YedYZ molybdopterin-dependent catalytic subunit
MGKKPISRRQFIFGPQDSPITAANGTFVPKVAFPTITTRSPLIDENGFTPIPHFYRQQLQGIPQITTVYWALRIYGLVEKPLTMTYDDLLGLPSKQVAATLSCVGGSARNPMIGNGLWTGIPLAALLEKSKPTAKAKYVQFYSADGYTTYLETDRLGDAILAYQLNNELLPTEHGYPVRLIVPGTYGYKMPKWIQRIEFTDAPQPGFWEKRGWSAIGTVLPVSTILSPHHQETVRGVIQISGIAYAGDKAIEKIEISVNDSPWMPIPFHTTAPNVWTPWQVDWKPPAPGDYLLKVRAHDEQGISQSADSKSLPNRPATIQNLVIRVEA